MSRLFTYRFEDGLEIECQSIHKEHLLALENEHGKCTYNGWAEFMGVGQPSRIAVIGGVHTKGDGYKSGWHPGLGMHIGGPAHYSKVLKEKGMVEVGNEKRAESAPKKKSYITEEVLREAVSAGAEISTTEGEKLLKGESLSD